jgi:ABC-type amino acid transport substrate-binding protein
MNIKKLIIFFLLTLSLKVFSKAAEPTVKVVISQGIEPFAIESTQSGLTVDVIRAAFASQSIKTKFIFLPNSRKYLEYKAKNGDVFIDIKKGEIRGEILTRWPVSTYGNQAITLKKKKLKINSISDLSSYRVIAWQNASKVLGPIYVEMTKKNKSYQEFAHMPSPMLFLDRTDVIISQPDIFRYNLVIDSGNDLKTHPNWQDIEYHDVLGKPNIYWYAFRSETLRNQFEKGIEAIYANQKIDEIFVSYYKKYNTTREMFIELDCRFLKKDRSKKCQSL